MFKKMLKNSSKFLAVLLTAVLAFGPLSYAADPIPVSNYTQLKNVIGDENIDTVEIATDLNALAGDGDLGDQKASSLTINGNDKTINGNSVAGGMETGTNFVLDGNGNKKQIGTDDEGDPIYEQVSKETVINDAIFTNFKKDGGAGTVIFNEGGNVTIERSSFTKNVIVPGTTSGSGGAPSGVGGVISHDSVEQIDDNQESIEIGTLTVKNSYFGQNQAFGAGAILSQGHLLVEDTEFNGNTADHFGAIAVMGNKKDSTVLTRVNFINNQGLVSGGLPNAGAIFFGEDANAKISDSKFEDNTSIEDGGAINTYPMASHPDLKHAKLQVVGSTFTGNKAGFDFSAGDTTDGASKGGAINNAFYGSETMPSTLEGKTVTDAGYVYVADSKFNENKAGKGGAIYNNKNLDGQSEARMWIENTEFKNNVALSSGGAIYNEGTIVIGDEVNFTSNTATGGGQYVSGGAIYNVGVSTIGNSVIFKENNAGGTSSGTDIKGGAIYNEGEMYVKDNVEFNSNTSGGFGGAIYNKSKMEFGNGVQFNSNISTHQNGGAIYNEGGELIFNGEVTFSNNKSTINSTSGGTTEVFGGAIYNENGVVSFNDSANFENNYVNSNDSDTTLKYLNDIYNSGTLNFNGGTVTMTGGIKGNGNTAVGDGTESAMVTLDETATLEQATLKINKNSELSVNIEKLKIYDTNNQAYGIISNSGNLVFSTGTGTLQNSVLPAEVGTSNENTVFGTITVKENADVTIQGREGNNITINQKDIIIEEDANLTITNGTIAPSISLQDNIKNDGVLTFNGNETMNLDFGIVKNEGDTGNVVIDGSVKVNAGDQEITQSTVTINSNAGLTVNANKILTDNAIANAGKLTFKRADGDNDTSDMINGNEITGVQGDNGMEYGELYIEDNLTNAENVKQTKILIGRGIKVTNSGEIVTTGEGIVINGDAVLTTSGNIDTYSQSQDTNKGIHNSGIFETTADMNNGNDIFGGEVRITQGTFDNHAQVEDTDYYGSISNATITVAEGAVFVSTLTVATDTVGADNTKQLVDSDVQNAGVVKLYGGTVTKSIGGLAVQQDNGTGVYETVTKYGETIFEEGATVYNEANISQSTVTVKGEVYNGLNSRVEVTADKIQIVSGGSLTTNANYLQGFYDPEQQVTKPASVENEGDLIFNGGTNSNVVTGQGTLTITNNTYNENNISQSTVTVANDAFFTNDASGTIETNYISGGSLQNDGKFVLNIKDGSSYGLSSFSGVGVSSITANTDDVEIDLGSKTITQGTIYTYGDKTLQLTGGTVNSNIVNYMTGNCLDLATIVNGTLENTTENPETQGVVNILEGGSVTGTITNSSGTINILTSNYDIANGITGNSDTVANNNINIGSATDVSDVTSSTTISYQTITVSSGSLTMQNSGFDGSIEHSSITVETAGLLKINPENLKYIENPITNKGIIKFYGETSSNYAVNKSTIAGDGELQIEGDIENQEGTGITQNQITIGNYYRLTANASDIDTTAGTGILNAGDLVFKGTADMVNNNVIDGLTTEDATHGPMTTYGNLTVKDADSFENKNQITQQNITISNNHVANRANIEAKGTFTTDSNDFTNYSLIKANDFINNGTLENNSEIYADTLTNNSLISLDSAGAVIFSTHVINKGTVRNYEEGIYAGSITNYSGGVIENNYVGIISATDGITNKNGGTITSNADNIFATVFNEGTYNVTGGTVSITIDGSSIQNGTINMATSEVTISTAIKYNDIYVSTGAVFKKDADLAESSKLLIYDGAIININNTDSEDNRIIGTLEAGNGIYVQASSSWTYTGIDVDLQQGEADKLVGDIVSGGSVYAFVDEVNLLTKKASKTKVQISTVSINARPNADGSIDERIISTGDGFNYSLRTINDETIGGVEYTGSWLEIGAYGYGGLPNALYDGEDSYSLEDDGSGNDYVTAWIQDSDRTLKKDFSIMGDGVTVLVSTTNVEGLQTSTNTLTARSVIISSFTNAITVQEGKDDQGADVTGTFVASNVSFTDNNGAAVIASSGTVDLSKVTFANNNTEADIISDGVLIFRDGAIALDKGVKGEGELMVLGNNIENGSSIEQSTVTISDGITFTNEGTINTKSIAGATLNNNGILEMTLEGDDAYGLEALTSSDGIGISSITVEQGKTATIDTDNGTISQRRIYAYGEGTLLLTGSNGITADFVNYTTGNCLDLETIINGSLLNSTENPETQGIVNILAGGSVTGAIENSSGTINILSPNYNIANGITGNPASVSNNIVNIGSYTATSSTAAAVTSATTISYQNITISSGSLTMNDGSTDGIIDNSVITVEENGTLVVNASNITNLKSKTEGSGAFIDNKGTIEFTGGTIDNNINYDYNDWSSAVREGNVIIADDTTNNGAVIYASTVTVNPDKILTNNGSTNYTSIATNYVIGNKIINNAKFAIDMQSAESYQLNELTGTGITEFNNLTQNIDLDISGKTISQSEINFYGDKTLRIIGGTDSSTTIIATSTATNHMFGDSLHLQNTIIDTPLFKNYAHVVFENGSGVTGVIENNYGTMDIWSENFVTNGKITAGADYRTYITDNILNIGDASNAAVVASSHTIEYQTITVSSGSLTMQNGTDYGSIKDSSITVATDGLLTVNPENLINIEDPVTNNGIVDFIGGVAGTPVLNVSTITGTGELKIDGWVENQEGTGLTQNSITISEGNGFFVNANDIDTTAGTGIANDGSIYFVGDNTVNTSTITATDGKGSLYVVANKLENTAQITQNYVEVNAGSELDNINEITAYDLDVNGVLENGTAEKEGTITVGNELNNYGIVTNTSGTIVAKDIYNNSTGATIYNEQNAVIQSTGFLYNNGTIESTGTITAGAIGNTIDGTLNNYKGGVIESTSIENYGLINTTGTITANEITNTSGATITNFDGGTITAREIKNIAGSSAIVYNEQNAVIKSTSIINEGIIETTGTIVATEIKNMSGATITNFDGGTISAANGISNQGHLITYDASGIDAIVTNDGNGTTNGVYDIYAGTITKNIYGTGSDKATVNLLGAVEISTEAFISQNKVNLGNGTDEASLKLWDETSLRAAKLVISSNTTLDTRNGKVGEVNTDGSIIISSGVWNFALDVNLKDGKGDKLLNVTADDNSVATISDLNFLTDKASKSYILISTGEKGNINVSDEPVIYTSKFRYSVKNSTMSDAHSTWLEIGAFGYGGLPNAVYDGASIYSVTGEEGDEEHDYVTEWITDEDGQHDTLKTDLKINGNGRILLSSTSVTGIRTGAYSLKVSSLTGFNGFTNAITVEQVSTTTASGEEINYGSLDVKDVTFSNNTGDAVIASSGIVTLNNVTFDGNTLDTTVIANENTLTISSVTFTNNTADSDILNNGELLIIGEASTFENGILGTGTTTIRGVAVDLSTTTASLQQSRVEISDIGDSSLTANVENTNVGLFLNNGQLVLLSSTTTDLNSEINGIGDTTISGGTVTTTKGIAQTNIYLSSTSVNVSSSMKATIIDVDSDSSLTADADNIDTFAAGGGIDNNGLLKFTAGTNNNTITGSGDMSILGDVTNAEGTRIEQSTITVGSGNFTTNASDVLANIVNGSNVTFTGGVNNSTVTYYAGGALTVTGDLINNAEISSYITIASGTTTNNGKITSAGSLQIAEGAGLITNANDAVADEHSSGIINDGALTFTGGVNVSTITGSGNLLVTDDLTNGVNIEQAKVTIASGTTTNSGQMVTSGEGIVIAEGATLITTNRIDTTANGGKIINDGLFEVNVENSDPYTPGDETVKSENIVEGTGEFKLSSTTFANIGNGSIKQGTITIADSDSVLRSDVDKVVAEIINNEGGLILQGTGTNKNEIGGNGYLMIDGSVVNSTGTAISQSSITVASGKFETSANDITTTDGIVNEAELTLTGGTLAASNAITGSGNLTVTDNLTNLAAIQQDGEVSITKGLFDNQNEADGSITAGSITVASGAGLKTKANSLATDNGIANEGDVTLTGGVLTASNTITGAGNLFVTEAVTSSAAITQSSIVVTGSHFSQYVGKLEATDVVVAEGSDVTIGSEFEAVNVLNDGVVSITNGLTNDSSAEYKGIGTLNIAASTTFNNNNSIKQSTVTVEEGSTLKSSADDITTSDGVLNAGTFMLTGGTNKNVIAGKDGTLGEVLIEGTVVNSTGTAINQKKVIISSGKEFTTSANDVTTEEEITNYGTMNFTGGTNNNIISGNGGVLNIQDSVVNNQKNISQETINVEKGTFENVRGGIIHATTVDAADETTVITDAADFNVTDMTLGSDSLLKLVDISSATLKTNVTGDGALVKEGEGIVTLSGTNDYAGTTTISEGALQISSATNIGTNTIYADGGKLIVDATDAEVELGNKIVGTYGDSINDVKLEVVAGTATLNTSSIIYGNGNLEKTGEGILNLRMDENKYIGDTVISSGTVIGTTKNIKGKVIGSGDETSAVEFYDADGEVILNEIDTTDYIGTFAKTGASTMTVTNAFKAQTANISSGTFVINNADVDGNVNTDFIVLGSMTVTNALLKGYSNITAADLIISTGATFAPGNSTATIQQTGNLKFEGDGTYDVEFGQVDMDKSGFYNDKTVVSGTTEIGEDAKITLNNLEGKYYVHETINLIESGTLADGYEYKDGNVVFNDNDATDLRAGYDTRISTRVYTEGNTLKIDLERKSSEYAKATEFKKSHNEQEAATAIDAVSTGNGGDITAALDTLEKFYYYETTYSTDSLKAALNDTAGVIHANATNLAFFNAKAEHVYDKIKERTLDLYPCTKFHDKIWAEYYYNHYDVDKDDNSPKYNSNVNGFLVGFDAISAKGWTLGVMAGYGTSELKQENNDKANLKDINAGLYGGYEGKKWSFKSMLLGGYEDYDIDRQIAFMNRTARSQHKGYSGALDAELGYKISLNKKGSTAKHKAYLRPFIGAIGSYMNNEGYEEKDAEDLNLKVEGYDAFSAEARAGLGINGKVKKFGWYAKAGVRQLLTEKYNEIEMSLLSFSDVTKMKIRSAENSQTTITGGIGADYQLSDAWTIFANGLGNFGDNATNYYANIGLAYKFGCVNNKPKNEVTNKDTERLSELLNSKMESDALLKKQLDEKNKELKNKQKELDDAKAREKELQNRIQKYEANIVSETKAEALKEKTLKRIKLKNKPTFYFGTAKLTKKGKASLAQVVEELKQYPDDSELLIEGYTDSVGPDDVNQKLSEDRAAAIATTLKKDYNVKNNINVIGKGEQDPIAPNNTTAGRAKNRRVEIIITAPVDGEVLAEEGEEIVDDDSDEAKFVKVKQQ